MENMPPEVRALVFGLGAAAVIAIVLLVFGERPGLAAAVRAWIGGSAGAVFAGDRNDMSSSGAEEAEEADENDEDQPATTTTQDDNNVIAITDNERNALLFAGAADALAAMVHAGKVGETDGIWIVYKVKPSSSNKTYQAARTLLKARLERLRGPQPGTHRPLTPAQQAVRDNLGLTNKN